MKTALAVMVSLLCLALSGCGPTGVDGSADKDAKPPTSTGGDAAKTDH